jgi:hypothetical protein
VKKEKIVFAEKPWEISNRSKKQPTVQNDVATNRTAATEATTNRNQQYSSDQT